MSTEAARLQAKFREGLALHRRGDLAGAERIYRDVLGGWPAHFDSLHMLGLIALQRRQTEAGIALVRQAIGVNDAVAAAHNISARPGSTWRGPRTRCPASSGRRRWMAIFAKPTSTAPARWYRCGGRRRRRSRVTSARLRSGPKRRSTAIAATSSTSSSAIARRALPTTMRGA